MIELLYRSEVDEAFQHLTKCWRAELRAEQEFNRTNAPQMKLVTGLALERARSYTAEAAKRYESAKRLSFERNKAIA